MSTARTTDDRDTDAKRYRDLVSRLERIEEKITKWEEERGLARSLTREERQETWEGM